MSERSRSHRHDPDRVDLGRVPWFLPQYPEPDGEARRMARGGDLDAEPETAPNRTLVHRLFLSLGDGKTVALILWDTGEVTWQPLDGPEAEEALRQYREVTGA